MGLALGAMSLQNNSTPLSNQPETSMGQLGGGGKSSDFGVNLRGVNLGGDGERGEAYATGKTSIQKRRKGSLRGYQKSQDNDSLSILRIKKRDR